MKYSKAFIPILLFLIIPTVEAAFNKIIIVADDTPILEIKAHYDVYPRRNIVPSAIIVQSLLPVGRMKRLGRHPFINTLGRFAQSLSSSGAITITSGNEFDTNFVLSFDSSPSLSLYTPNIDMMDWQVVFSNLNQHNLLDGNGCQIPCVHPLLLFFSNDFLDYIAQHVLGEHITSQEISVPWSSFKGHTNNRITDGLVFTQTSNENDLVIKINHDKEEATFVFDEFLKHRFYCSIKSSW